MLTKLAFLAVYVFDEKTHWLFDSHLEGIRRHTRVNFRMFAAAHKLPEEMPSYVDSQPDVENLDRRVLAHYHAREEYSHCLGRLVQQALAQHPTYRISVAPSSHSECRP